MEICVQVDGVCMEELCEELWGLMWCIWQLDLEEKDDFELNEQCVICEQIDLIKNGIVIGGLMIIGFLFFVGVINIMNIIYVSVKECMKEIGMCKVLGVWWWMIFL